MPTNEAICVTCGTQYETSGGPPALCPICEDDRQYVNPDGQQWTSMADLRAGGTHRNLVVEVEPGLIGIRTDPTFAIAQRAHLIQTEAGNLLWDCISYLDEATVSEVNQRGGIAAIAISHPHFYSSMVEWSRAFGGVPIYLHADNQPWVMRPDPAIRYWSEETVEPLPGLSLVRCGGHFPGSTVVHWPAGAEGRGSLLTGDTIYVVADPRWVTFMYSYPNSIPLDAPTVRRIVAAVEPFDYDRLYSSWPGRVIAQDAKAAVHRSAERYIAKIGG
jgi:glyoxylase-like metal-dependent hydrolase (beta-lactamase superfamily II)